MRIENIDKKAINTYEQQVQRVNDQAKAETAQQQQKPAKTDEVSLSTQARELQKAKEAVEASPDVRQEKVAAIKAQVEAGTYNIPAGYVAAKMLEKATNGE